MRGILCLDRRGVALPMALFGLVAISVLVTSALLTASTELALSRAHQEAISGLHAADDAVERFVAGRAALALENSGPEPLLVPGTYASAASDGATFHVSVAALGRRTVEGTSGAIRRSEVFSIIATPGSGWGRSVGALVEVAREAEPVGFEIDAPVIVGSDMEMEPGATISNESPGVSDCDTVRARAALRMASGMVVTPSTNATVEGRAVVDTLVARDLVRYALGDRTIEDVSAFATVRFGARFGTPGYSGTVSQWSGDPSRRWGCPASLLANCQVEEREHLPVVAIDGSGGIIEISGEHGQGILVVLGNLHIRNDFRFAGLILVDGVVSTSGSVVIEGAVIATGGSGDGTSSVSHFGSGTLIRFNACRIAEAKRALALQALETAPFELASGSFGWFEVVR